MRAGKAMGLKERIENNIFSVIVGTVVMTATIVAGAVSWFAQQREALSQEQYQSKIDAIETRVSSIERRIGGQKYLDIKSMFTPGNAASAPPSNLTLRYFPEGHYSALSSMEGFTYEKSSEGELIAQIVGSDIGVFNFARGLPVDAWVGRSEKVDGSPAFKTIFPFVYAETISYEAIGNVYDQFSTDIAKMDKNIIDTTVLSSLAPTGEQNSTSEEDKKFDELLRKEIRLDFAVPTLLGALAFCEQMNMSPENNTRCSVTNIEKVGPLLYCQQIFTMTNVKIDGVHRDTYYVARELFLINTKDGITAIATATPTTNPFVPSRDANKITEWLSLFRIEQL